MLPLSPAQRAVVEILRPDAGGPDAAWPRAEIDWQEALAFANAHYLAPALHASVAGAGRAADLPTDVAAYLAFLHDANRVRNQHLASQLRELVATFNEAGIRPLLLKGAMVLTEHHLGDPASRMLRDLDLLVPVGKGESALRALKGLGYEVLVRYPHGHHAYGDFARHGSPGAVDLHFELTDAPYLLSASEVWRRARPVSWQGTRLYVPSATDAALHNLVHAQIHYLGDYYRGVIELRQLYDFARLAGRYGDGIDWPFIERRMAGYRLLAPLQSYALAAHRLFALRWPLAEPPSMRARFHCRRCLVQQRLPALVPLTRPWANMRSAFARHRMDGLYETTRPLVARWYRHMLGVLDKGGLRLAISRLLRAR